jgi:diguanylate cyclase (GGDEF)-like protein/PAS domain S-box-containing protein
MESDNAAYRTLLESTQAIPWKIEWASMKFACIGPQIEALLGWAQNSWRTADDWATRIHPEDRERVVNFCMEQAKAGVDHEVDYRALTKNNGTVWIRYVVHVVRNAGGEVASLIGFMFDISERKIIEEKLLVLQQELEALSFRDSLTGVANRRRFDASLDQEWASALRSGLPLSLIMIDIDFFEQYTDQFGQMRGEETLKNIAQTFSLVVTRPRDLVARLGGEQFVMILPETDANAAQQVAQRCRNLIAQLEVRHEAAGSDGIVTVSMGIGTIKPDGQMIQTQFIEAVDRLLYRARENGHNRIEAGNF